MLVYQVFSSVLALLVIPFFTGAVVCRFLSVQKGYSGWYVVGTFAEWTLIQLVSVPFILAKASFIWVFVLLTIFLVLLCLYGIYLFVNGRKERLDYRNRLVINTGAVFAIMLMTAAYSFMAYKMLTTQYISLDDSRFVVNAVDIVRTNRMFLTNPSTGEAIPGFWGDMHRDALSPWAVYYAWLSKFTAVPVTIMAHTILPQVLLLMMACVYWLIARELFHENSFAVSSAVFLAFLVVLFGVRNGYDPQAFILTTIWQGKGTVAAIGIPAVFLAAIWVWKDCEGWKTYLFFWFVIISMCLMSGTGIVNAGIMTGAFCIAYGILKRKISVFLKIGIGLLPVALFYFLTQVTTRL